MKPILLVALALLAGLLGGYLARPAATQATAAHKESTFERIMRTGEIRCGYLPWPPMNIKDPTTGAVNGIIPDYIEALAKAAGLKVVWQEELNLGTYLADLNNHRYDLECSGGWPNALRAKRVIYTTPIAGFPLVPMVRANDTRFDQGLDTINQPSVKIAVTSDGSTDDILRQRRFPKSQALILPQLSSSADMLMTQVLTGKADAAFPDKAAGEKFMAANPGKLKLLPWPARLVDLNLSMGGDEQRLVSFLNTGTRELQNDGVIDAILDKYDPTGKNFARIAPTYQPLK